MISYPYISRISGYHADGRPIYDRTSNSTQQRQLNRKIFSPGVDMRVATAFQVTAGDGMTVVVSPGMGMTDSGAMFFEYQIRTLVVQASEAQDRIDLVVVRDDLGSDVRSTDLYVVKGTAAATPIAPKITRNSSISEHCIAQIFVSKNTTTVTNQRITDTRLDTNVCGVFATAWPEVDTTPYFNQIQAIVDEESAAWQIEFSTWFKSIKGQLSTDAAGHLQNEIDALTAAQHKTMTITVTASDSSSMASQHITILDAATESEIIGFDYSGQPESVQLYPGASYKIVAQSKMGYVDVPPVLGVLTTDKSVTLNYIRGTRYGFQRSKTNSAAAGRITYLFDAARLTPAAMNTSTNVMNYGGWEDVVNAIVAPVMLNNDGTEAYELNHDDQTKKLDGTASEITSTTFAGNAMVRFGPAFKWVKRYEDSSNEYVIFCDCQFDADYHAYAHTNARGNVVDNFYWGMFKGSNVSSKLRSIAGQGVMVSQTRNTEVAYAQANGDGYDTIYKSGWDYIADLLTLISKSDDSQMAFGTGRCASGNTAGTTPGSLKSKPAFCGSTNQTSDVKVLYIEGFWGNYWEGMRGLINASGNIKAKMVPPYNFDGTGYIATGKTPAGTSGNYISSASVTDEAGFIPVTASGSSTTYYCDGLGFNNSRSNYAMVGGSWFVGTLCGSRYVILDNAASATDASIGSRLSFVPPTA